MWVSEQYLSSSYQTTNKIRAENLKAIPVYNKVMIIDDNYTDRYVGEIRLKKHPFAKEVILKDSGRSALEFLEVSVNAPGDLPQLIFLDINMPEMNGFEFLEGFALLPEIVHATCDIMMLS